MDPTPQPSLSLTEASDLRYLDPSTLRFFRHGAALRLTIQHEMSCLNVMLVRLFPLSDSEHYLSVRSDDHKEIGIIPDATALDTESRRLIAEELSRRYLVPVVHHVLSVKERFGTVDWQVETDRGRCTFTMRNIRENVVQPSSDRYLLIDVEGNRYDVRDIQALDPASRAYLSRYL